MDFYGTLGTACQERETMLALFQAGMTGARLNLSHVTLAECAPLLSDFWSAAREAGCSPRLVIDLQGPELRVGRLPEAVTLPEGGTVLLVPEDGTALRVPEDLPGGTVSPPPDGGPDGGLPFPCRVPVPERVLYAARAGDRIALDDSAFLLEARERTADGLFCRVLRGGRLQSRKSLSVLGRTVDAPALTAQDRENLRHAAASGVTDILQPFVRGREDVEALRDALARENLRHVRVMAKIENRQGLDKLDEIIAAADEICIARGDLGNGMPLWKLPGIQKEISRRCRAAGRPFCVATQLLWSMHERAVPTRAEVLDIYNAALDGAAGLMLTGETAVGKYPVEAMRYLCRTAREGLPCSLSTAIQKPRFPRSVHHPNRDGRR